MSAPTVREHVEQVLEEVAFPATKDDLVDAAIRKGEATAVQALRELPETDYADRDEVLRAVGDR